MQHINKSMINIIPINSLSSEITSTNPIDLQLTLRQSFLILYESGHSLMTGILPGIWKPSISETVLGAKISLFNRLANNAPRRASGRRVRQLFFKIDGRKVFCPWWYRGVGATSQQITAKRNFFCFRLLERSRSTVLFSFTSSHDSRYLFYSCYVFWGRESFQGPEDAELFLMFTKHREVFKLLNP